MNERIRELAEQAGIKLIPMIVDGVEYDYEDVEMDGSEDLQKFANLIIQEFARQHNLEHAERSHMIHKAIKEHFGVTE